MPRVELCKGFLGDRKSPIGGAGFVGFQQVFFALFCLVFQVVLFCLV